MGDIILNALGGVLGELVKTGAEALGITPGEIAEGFAAWAAAVLAGAIEGLLAPLLNLVTDPISFDFAGELTSAFQAIALLVCFVVAMGRGATRGIVGAASDEDWDLVRYLWRTLAPAGAVIVSPSVAAVAVSASSSLVSAVSGTDGAGLCANVALLCLGLAGSTGTLEVSGLTGAAVHAATGAAGLVVGLVLMVAVAWNLCALVLEICKRWIQLELISIVIPLTAVSSAVEDGAADMVAALKTMAGIGVTIVLQVLMLSAAAAASSGVATGEADAVAKVFVVLAVFAAARSLPSWIDKFTYAAPAPRSAGGALRMLLAITRAASRARR